MKKIPIGVSDFKELIETNYYYIDKTSLIKEIINSGSKITLLTRPRRFGKTLNMSMLRYFFEKGINDNSHLFKNLDIYKSGEEYISEQGKYPVIYLTFKDVKEENWDNTYSKLKKLIINEFKRLEYVKSCLDKEELKSFNEIIEGNGNQPSYENSIFELSQFLNKYHKEKVVFIIDEYDTPMNAGHINGYNKEILDFTRGFFSAGLKDNINIHKGIITGILRISKESIFSDMNNLKVCTIIDESYSDKFGFTEKEVINALKDFKLENKSEEMKQWYNGYSFGKTVIYNPWSIINFLDNKGQFEAYWVNTSGNELIKKVFKNAPKETKKELEELIKGNTIKKEISPNITFEIIDKLGQSIWTFLLYSGYLTGLSEEKQRAKRFFDLKIPNEEVLHVYQTIIMKWFEENASNQLMEEMLKCLLDGDVETFTYMFQDLIRKSISYFDPTGEEPEMFYHAFVLGMLVHLNNQYEVKSNRESGYGRYDVSVIPREKNKKALIIEFKKVNKMASEDFEIATKKALAQIESKKYEEELLEREIVKDDIIKLAIVFDGKLAKITQGK